MEGPFTVVLLSEWMEDDVDHSKLIFSRVDDIIHSAFFLTRVHSVCGSEFHNLVKHMLIHVSRITESKQILRWCDTFFPVKPSPTWMRSAWNCSWPNQIQSG